jgi:hypothetical protein
MAFQLGVCAICQSGGQKVVIPLHDKEGGPLVCHICYGKWHAEHGRKRKAGRVVVRAMRAFEAAGGSWKDIDKLKISTAYGMFSALESLETLSDIWPMPQTPPTKS